MKSESVRGIAAPLLSCHGLTLVTTNQHSLSLSKAFTSQEMPHGRQREQGREVKHPERAKPKPVWTLQLLLLPQALLAEICPWILEASAPDDARPTPEPWLEEAVINKTLHLMYT